MTRYLYLPPVPRVRSAGSWLPQIGFRKMVAPKRPPVTAYTTPATAPIGANGVGQTIVSGGTATVRIGPSGLGTRWYPNQCTLATASGAADTSPAIGYLGPQATPSQVVFTSYAGGGDIQGLAVPMMQPGDLLTVVWSGAKNGDYATLVIIGDQQVLTPALVLDCLHEDERSDDAADRAGRVRAVRGRGRGGGHVGAHVADPVRPEWPGGEVTMKVWLVEYQPAYEPGIFIGVFATEELANEAKDRQVNSGNTYAPTASDMAVWDEDVVTELLPREPVKSPGLPS